MSSSLAVNNETALHVAVQYGHRHIVQYLLQTGADPNARARSPHPPTPQTLLPLHYAILYSDNLGIAKDLLAAGADPYVCPSAFRFACNEARADIANLILDRSVTPYPMPYPSPDRGALILSICMGFDYTTDRPSQLRLLRRVLNEDPSLVDTLDNWNADGELMGPLRGTNPLIIIRLCQELGSAKAAPLHELLSGEVGNADAIRLLLEHGANVNVLTNTGENALHLLAQGGEHADLEAAKVLVEYGIEVDALNPNHAQNWTAYQIADDVELKAYLASVTARTN
ncbi:hypothetical protein HK097_003028 [Rhizophlyctis rosea]|uniref:Ankyrin n=1 Tax=Rhizophlyctis rosea TaxID=64517 RepID=A0AAD5S2S3_9FUNG|nr:hypothetical protein HK097_003028 [Rhizophlyctis rosea]